MALAKGKSTIRVDRIELHTETMLSLLPLFIPGLETKVTEEIVDEKKQFLIEIDGIGLPNVLS